jgi:5'-nucleotidase
MKRILLFLFLSMMLILPLSAEGVQETKAEGDWPLTIIHTNDAHSHLTADYKGRYGAAKIAYMADQVRSAYDNVLFLDAGDYTMGTVFFTVFEGAADRDVMNMMDYDAMTLGNHEFDKGNAGMLKFLNGLETPVVNANVDFSEYPEVDGYIQPYLIRRMDGRSVGIIGATLPETPTISSPAEKVVFRDVVRAVQPVVDELEARGIDIIILLSHNGFMNDQEIAAELDGVDVIVGGHSHTELLGTDYPNVVQSVSDDPVIIVQAAEYNKYLGNLTVLFDEEGIPVSWWGAPVKMTASIPSDPEVQAYIADKNEELAPFTGKVLGSVKTELVRSRTEESNIGNLIADAMLDAVKDQGVQIALTNAGGIRADVGTGEITMQGLMEVLPFGNLVATFEIKGSDLWQVFEHGVSQYEEGAGRFLQMAGVKIVWDPSAPAFDYATQSGGRVTKVSVSDSMGGWKPLDDNAIYKVAANNYIRGGGDDFQVLKEKAINPYDAGPLDLDVVTDFLSKHPAVDYRVEGRITTVAE